MVKQLVKIHSLVKGACRTWYNETFLESLGGPVPGSRPPVGSADGVPLDQEHNSVGKIVYQTQGYSI